MVSLDTGKKGISFVADEYKRKSNEGIKKFTRRGYAFL